MSVLEMVEEEIKGWRILVMVGYDSLWLSRLSYCVVITNAEIIMCGYHYRYGYGNGYRYGYGHGCGAPARTIPKEYTSARPS